MACPPPVRLLLNASASSPNQSVAVPYPHRRRGCDSSSTPPAPLFGPAPPPRRRFPPQPCGPSARPLRLRCLPISPSSGAVTSRASPTPSPPRPPVPRSRPRRLGRLCDSAIFPTPQIPPPPPRRRFPPRPCGLSARPLRLRCLPISPSSGAVASRASLTSSPPRPPIPRSRPRWLGRLCNFAIFPTPQIPAPPPRRWFPPRPCGPSARPLRLRCLPISPSSGAVASRGLRLRHLPNAFGGPAPSGLLCGSACWPRKKERRRAEEEEAAAKTEGDSSD
ncbi:hypothetical protein GUJ93_ZPchr0010g10615 [Zizania palustris]|uniref:Uncharacterized protein n=1 Tax=Zizania palustris TaxID=103762 RepID=A0A8J6BGU8_ZIZPA|nr:hypothetical protein GUJ93_ZPchr0010g10615 [Zizania palustris]